MSRPITHFLLLLGLTASLIVLPGIAASSSSREIVYRGAAQVGATSTCGSIERNDAGSRISGSFVWYFDASTTPSYLDVAATERALRNAHNEWAENRNHCGVSDRATERVPYGGRRKLSFGRDGLNAVLFGSADQVAAYCGTQAIACTFSWMNPFGGAGSESDTILSLGVGWANGAEPGKLDVWSVMAHEFGHTLGFGHVQSPENVMYPMIWMGDISNRLLGRGDALENNAKYAARPTPSLLRR